MSLIIKPGCPDIDNDALLSGLFEHQNDSDVRRTHEFGGRFENIYLTESKIPALSSLKACALQHAEDIVDEPITEVGYWFNAMPPGACTTKHDHNDGYELLSGCYYVTIPKHSGNLLIYAPDRVISHQPVVGEFVFFKPDVVHEVECNESDDMRLSIAFNFIGAS